VCASLADGALIGSPQTWPTRQVSKWVSKWEGSASARGPLYKKWLAPRFNCFQLSFLARSPLRSTLRLASYRLWHGVFVTSRRYELSKTPASQLSRSHPGEPADRISTGVITCRGDIRLSRSCSLRSAFSLPVFLLACTGLREPRSSIPMIIGPVSHLESSRSWVDSSDVVSHRTQHCAQERHPIMLLQWLILALLT